MRYLKSLDVRAISRIALVVIMTSGLATALLPALDSTSDSHGLTVGGFAAMIATRLQSADSPMAPLTADEGQALLRKAGIKLQKNPNALLTEADAVDILGQLGVTLESGSPTNLLDAERARSIIGVFGRTIASKTGILSTNAPSKNTTTAGIRSFSGLMLETTIEDCQLLGNDGKTQDCQACCRDLFSADQNDFHTNRVCAKACNTKSRNVSGSEPLP